MRHSSDLYPLVKPKRSPVLATVVVAFLTTALAAQRSVVVPSSGLYSATTPHNLLSLSCLPNSGPSTVQNLFFVEPQAGGYATGVAFRRRDFPNYSPSTYPPLTVEIELGMSHTPRPPALVSWRLPENRASDYRVVVDRRTFQFPALPWQPGTYPFSYRFPFDRPFLLVPGRVALWQMTKYRSSACWLDPQPLGFDAAGWPRDFSQAPVIPIGSPCGPDAVSNLLTVSSLTVGNFGWAMMRSQRRAHGQSFALIYCGLGRDRWGAFSLPLDLAPFGAPGCFVHVSLDFLWPLDLQYLFFGTTDAPVDLPHEPQLVGTDLFFQAVRFFANINPLDMATSNGVQARIGPHQVTNGAMVSSGVRGQPDLGARSPMAMIFELMLQ